MVEVDPRDAVIREGLNRWHKNKYIGTLNYVTGTGKTVAGIKAIEYVLKLNKKASILIICPSHAIIDNWHREFSKFRVSEKNITFQCINTAYLVFGTSKWDLVIADEIHNYLANSYEAFFANNKYDKLLGLSAKIPRSKFDACKRIAPIIHRVDYEEASEKKLISPFKVVAFQVPFIPSQQIEYDNLTAKIDSLKQGKYTDSKTLIAKRIELVNHNIAKLEMVSKVVDMFKGEYGVIFTYKILTAERVHEELGDKSVVYHSAMTNAQKEKAKNLLEDGRTRKKIIISPKSLDEGVTVKRINWALALNGDSDELRFIQRLGRIVRLENPDKKAILVRLFMKHTVEYSWLAKSAKDLDIKFVSSLEALAKEIEQFDEQS